MVSDGEDAAKREAFENCKNIKFIETIKTKSYGNYQRQTAISQLSDNDYVAFIDDDDILNSRHVELITQHTDYDMVRFGMAMGVWYKDIDPGKIPKAIDMFCQGIHDITEYRDWFHVLDCGDGNDRMGGMGTGSFAIKASILKKCGWSQAHNQFSDWFTIENLLKNVKTIQRLDSVLYLARRI
jgi:glycosyltransferase involved in cell wall biosynthesis